MLLQQGQLQKSTLEDIRLSSNPISNTQSNIADQTTNEQNEKISKQPSLKFQSKQSKPAFSNFVISKYSSLSERDFNKVPISYINKIYQQQQIDLRKMHVTSGNTNQPITYTAVDFNKSSSIQHNPNKMNCTTDSYLFSQVQSGFDSAGSNSPNSLQNESYTTSRSMSSNNNYQLQSDYDVIKEENSSFQSPCIPNNRKLFSLSLLPPSSQSTQPQNIGNFNNYAQFKNQISLTSPQSNRYLIKGSQSEIRNPYIHNDEEKSNSQAKEQIHLLPDIKKNKMKYGGAQQQSLSVSKFLFNEESIAKTSPNFSQSFNKKSNKNNLGDHLENIRQTKKNGFFETVTERKSKDDKKGETSNQKGKLIFKSINEDMIKNGEKRQYYFSNKNQSIKDKSQNSFSSVSQIRAFSNNNTQQAIKSFNFSETDNFVNSLLQKGKRKQSSQQNQSIIGQPPQPQQLSQPQNIFQDIHFQKQQQQQQQSLNNLSEKLVFQRQILDSKGISNNININDQELFETVHNGIISSSIVENFQKLSLSSNSFLIKKDEEKEKLKNEHQKVIKEKKQANLTLHIRKSVNSGEHPLPFGNTGFEKMYFSPQAKKKEVNAQLPDNKPAIEIKSEAAAQIEADTNSEEQDSKKKDLKIFESKFVLHKPYNHTKNKAYIKNLQIHKTSGNNALSTPQNGEHSPYSPAKSKSPVAQSTQLNQVNQERKKSKDMQSSGGSITNFGSPVLSKNKSQFSKAQYSFSKFDSDDVENKSISNKRLSSTIFKSPEKESMNNSQKLKGESEEIKTGFVRTILDEQMMMYHEYQASLEIKIFEKKKQEHQLNIKNTPIQELQSPRNIHSSGHNMHTSINNLHVSGNNAMNQSFSGNSPPTINFNLIGNNIQFPLLQELLQIPAAAVGGKRVSHTNNKSCDYSPFTRSRNSSNASMGKPQIPEKQCLSPTISKFQMEQPLMIRRSSNQPGKNAEQQQQANGGSASPTLNPQGSNEGGLKTPDKLNRSQFSNPNIQKQNNQESNNQQNTIPIIPKLEISISNKTSFAELSQAALQRRNSKQLGDVASSPLNQQLNEQNQNIQINSPFAKHTHKQQTSMFSKMQSPRANLSRRQSNVIVFESDKSIKNNCKKSELGRMNSVNQSSDNSINSEVSVDSKDSANSEEQKEKEQEKLSQTSKTEQSQKTPTSITQQKTPCSDYNPPSNRSNKGGIQIQGFSESVKNYYEKQDSEEEVKSSTSFKENNNNRGSMHISIIQSQYQGASPRQQSISKIQNQEVAGKRNSSFSRFQSFESRGSVLNSPKNASATRVRPNISSSEQPSKQKGLATIYIELNDIMNTNILKNLENSEKLAQILNQHQIKMETISHYYPIFLQFVLIDDSKVFNPDTFANFKIHYQIFEQLQIILIDTLKSLNYNTHAIEQIVERLEYQKKYITEGLLLNEIGGSSGVLKMITESLDELNTKLPSSFTNQLNSEEKTAILTRVVNIICNQERLFSPNSNSYINSIEQKSSFNTEMQPYIHHFKDFSQMEFYCLKLTFFTSLKQRGYRSQTIFRFLEQFEKARYNISSTLTISNLLKDKQIFEQLITDYLWKIQHDTSLSLAFENNNEVIIAFCNSVILEFIYNLHGRLDLRFLLSKLPHLTGQHLNKLSSLLTGIVEYRGLSYHFMNDIKIKFLKISYKLGLVKSPITVITQDYHKTNFLEDLIQEINSIMHSDECFESFIRKFPEDKQSLTLGDTSSSQSGLRALSFFLLTILSDYDIYSIQDLHSSLQAFNVSITIPIQWKIAIEFALNNLKVPPSVSQTIIDIISVQFSLLYKNTQYESFNQVLLN